MGDPDILVFQCPADLPNQVDGSRRITVDAKGLGPQRDPSPIGCHDDTVPGHQERPSGDFDDNIAEYSRQVEGYASSPTPKRLVGISNAGHLVYSDLCGLKNGSGQDLMEIALQYEVANAELFEQLWDGCEPDQIDPQMGWEITNFATSAALESALHCNDADSNFADIQTRFPLVTDYREEL